MKIIVQIIFYSPEGMQEFLLYDTIIFFELLLLPILSLCLWLIVSKPKMTYIESLALGIYAFAAFEILIFFQILITDFLFKTNFLTNRFLIQIQIVSLAWSFFCFITFFKPHKNKISHPTHLTCPCPWNYSIPKNDCTHRQFDTKNILLISIQTAAYIALAIWRGDE